MNSKVILGFSGGVDSSASAILLQNRGYDVTGLYFDINGKDTAPDNVQKSADSLGIELITVNASELFQKCVISPFCSLYERGNTPNPCILCNPSVKFKLLLDTADHNGASYIATGHYAGVAYDDGVFRVRRGLNAAKDQSYMLYRLEQDVLSKLILPLFDCTDKEELRKLLQNNNIPSYSAKDSQDICFIPDGDYFKYIIDHNGKNVAGSFIGKDGTNLGPHQGILHYTIGQRKGLGIALGKPAFVTGIDSETGNVYLGDESDLLHKNVIVNQTVFSGLTFEEARSKFDGKSFLTKLRYTRKESSAKLEFSSDETIILHFDDPQRAPTPGQSAVFYDNDTVIGGGFII